MKITVYNHVSDSAQSYEVHDLEDLELLCHRLHVRSPETTSFEDAVYEVADDLSSHHMDAHVSESDKPEPEHAISPAQAIEIAMGYTHEPGVMERARQHSHLPEAGDPLPLMGHVTHAEVADGDLS